MDAIYAARVEGLSVEDREDIDAVLAAPLGGVVRPDASEFLAHHGWG